MELKDLTKGVYFSVFCQECRDILFKEIELRNLVYTKTWINQNVLPNCKKCGKNNYNVDIPYNFNMKCKNCGNKYFEKDLPFACLGMVLVVKDNLKNCEICGKNDFIFISEGKK